MAVLIPGVDKIFAVDDLASPTKFYIYRDGVEEALMGAAVGSIKWVDGTVINGGLQKYWDGFTTASINAKTAVVERDRDTTTPYPGRVRWAADVTTT